MQYKVLRRRNNIYCAITENNQTRGEVEDMEFPGVLKKEQMWKFLGLIKKEVEFPGLFMQNFHEFWFLTWNFQGLSHNFAEFPGVKAFFKVTNQKIPVGFFRKVYLQPLPPPTLIVFFPGIARWYHEKCTKCTFSIMPKAITQITNWKRWLNNLKMRERQ